MRTLRPSDDPTPAPFNPPRSPTTPNRYTISGVLTLWWYTHYPRALALGDAIAANSTLASTIGLHFTTQCWILNVFFDCPRGIAGLTCPSPAQVADVERAITAGYLTWHAFPFNSELELHSAAALAAGVGSCHALDARFALPRKTVLSQRDVPGTTRAALAPLAAAGVRAISIGVNGASTPPFVPRAFLWRDEASGTALPTFVHPYGYGGTDTEDAVLIPGLPHALVFAWRGDNAGPPESVAEIEGDFAGVRSRWPGAAVFASTLDDFAAALAAAPAALAALPVVTAEMADTWIHGAASDPVRLGFFRGAGAALGACAASGACAPGDAAVARVANYILKCGEHTWGTDVKSFLHDTTHWTNAALRAALAANLPNFNATVSTWLEQRRWCVDLAIAAAAGTPLAAPLAATLADLRVGAATPPPPRALGFAPLAPGAPFDAGRFRVGFDAATGAVATLVDGATGVAWAAPADGTALLWAHYVALDAADFTNFTGTEPDGYYPLPGTPPSYFPLDFGKPNLTAAGTAHVEAPAALASLWVKDDAGASAVSFLVETRFAAALVADYGAPAAVWTRLDVPRGAGGINVTVEVYNKTMSRVPEGVFLRFNASAPAGVRVVKLGADVDPYDVVDGGNHHAHGADAVAALAGARRLTLAAGAAGVAAVGRPWPLPAPVWANATDPREGAAFMLFANTWGTNYPQWYPFTAGQGDESARFRFVLEAA